MNRSVKLGLFIIVGIIVYAYGFSVTQVNLEELGMPARQEALTRILRALAHPDFFDFDQVEVEVQDADLCALSGRWHAGSAAGRHRRTLFDRRTDLRRRRRRKCVVEGHNLLPNADGPLNFIPPSGVSLQLDRIETDGNGFFSIMVELRNRNQR